MFAQAWCPACRMYMGLVDAMTGEPLGEMVHLPKCVYARDEDAIEDEMTALREEVERLREEVAVG